MRSITECAEYKESACDHVYAGNRDSTHLTTAKIPNCAFIVIPLIVGGEDATKKEFPHMVRFRILKIMRQFF